ncbi:MAG: MBL fold metallo-hydrolase [Anaerolineales bacterium]
MEIVWYGHACFRLRGRGSAVVTDPFRSDLGYELPRLTGTVVTISHDHSYHNEARVVRGSPYVITGPGDYEIGGVFITGIRTNAEPKTTPPNLRNTAYVIEIEGLNICHLGNLLDVPTQQQAEDLGPIDVLLLPVGGNSTLPAARAVEVVNVLEPRIVVPMMFRTADLHADLGPVESFLTEMAIDEVQTEELLKLTKSDLPEETAVRLLVPKRQTQ